MIAILAVAPALAGCPVMQNQRTPVSEFQRTEPLGQHKYWLYVPSTYSASRNCPLVITLHGTHGFDNSTSQIREWKSLAEDNGFIVAAPDLKSPQGILPVAKNGRFKDLADDEQTILNCLADVQKDYRIDPRAVLLTGFSAGGYAMYYVGLRHPDRFTALAARACNSDVEIFERIQLTDQARNMPIIIIRGRDDLMPLSQQSLAAYAWLRQHRCFNTEHHKIQGGHIRQPQIAWSQWRKFLPKEYQPAPRPTPASMLLDE